MAIGTVERVNRSYKEPERVSCFCFPVEFASGLRRTIKDSESGSSTGSHSSKSSKTSVYQSTTRSFKSKGSESDSTDSSSKSKGHSLNFRSKGSDSDLTSSVSILSCLRVPETEENDYVVESVPVSKLRWFPYKELEIATDCFSVSTVIRHAYFKMYRGTLASGEIVDVARLSGVGESRFRKEVQEQSRLEHENLLRLIGFSDDQGEQLFVLESVGLGTLDDHLNGSSRCSLSRNTRISIALGVARAMAYLHEQNPPIIHQDLRPKNIFLGGDLVPKVANYTSPFECSQLMAVARSWEYHDPESLSQEQTVNCNIFSFGVILLQLLTGRPTHDPRTKKSLVHRARRYQEKAQDENFEAVLPLLDSVIVNESVAELEPFWALILFCVGKDRPTMKEVVEALETLTSSGDSSLPLLG